MRGRKTDSEFISEFIAGCVKAGYDTPEAIIQQARGGINTIDEEIQRVERLKANRSKLLDVIATFEREAKQSKSEEARILSFFKIQHPQICKFICDKIKDSVIVIEDLGNKYSNQDLMFCIKQLIEHKIVAKSGNHLLRSDSFDDYLKFVLRES